MAGAVIIGAAETDRLGRLPEYSELELYAEAARRALADCGLRRADIDGITSAVHSPVAVAHALGIEPTWYDGTSVGGCSVIAHIRHATAAISAGLCSTVLVTHGESGRSQTGRAGHTPNPMVLDYERPYGVSNPANTFVLPVLRFMREWGITHEQLASVTVAQSKWAAGNPRAGRSQALTVDDVLASRIIAYPFHVLECCLVADGGGALVVTSRARAQARGFDRPLVYILGAGEATGTPMVSQMPDATSFGAFRRSSRAAYQEARLGPGVIDHVMIYDAFAHLPLYGLQDLGLVPPGEAGAFIAEGRTSPGGELPVNTNGGGLCYTHTGQYGMFAVQESVRQLRGTAFRQVDGVSTSLVQGVGGMFGAAATLVLANAAP
jgi:acetyl-CoA acetyltransferase